MSRVPKMRTIAGILAAVAVMSLGGPAHASEQRGPVIDPVAIESAMSAVAYDEAVAEANGFTIVTHEDGSWESVAVTKEAKAAEAKAGGPIGAGAPGDGSAQRSPVYAYGNCGNSWIQFIRAGNYVSLKTGYNVAYNVSNRIGWSVQVWSYDGNPWFGWADGPSGASWTSTSVGFFNSVGGFGTASGSVLMSNGVICSSGGPTSAI